MSSRQKSYGNDLIILHVGTNDLRENKSAKEIALNTIELAIDLKTEINDIMLSSIIPRNDKLNEKGAEVNNILKSLCSTHNFHIIDNSNISKLNHLNKSGLHLNYKGTYVLGSNLVDAINTWQISYAIYVCNSDKFKTNFRGVNRNIRDDREITEIPSTRKNSCTLPTLTIGNDCESPTFNWEENNDGNPVIILKELRSKNEDRLIIAHLNINFLRNKFEALKSLVHGKVDILVISETKLDESFPINKFILEGFSTPFRADRNSQGGGILVYIREDIPSKEI